ncbi:MAG TPA: LLM class flavin-dependent oxidoreductase [Abditibacteriaceae bacterium]|nr:LLM class flavin-dependent oxidoreductase [Abditibacteriaceae bacterium]
MIAEKEWRLSVLDLSPVSSGSSSVDALHNTLDLARLADNLGYTRYWLSEHHNTALLASASPEVLIGHVASVTERIRVGSGGIMLPNHAPLKVAETFRMLSALHPGRIDLGLGRAPGTDPMTALALRRSREAMGADDFPEQLSTLLAFLNDDFADNHPLRHIKAIPQGVAAPDIWMLGSSDFGALMAAQIGLGFAFAHHISPVGAVRAMRLYHERFQPSAYLRAPQSLLAVSVICAETDEAAAELARSADLTWLYIHQNKRAPVPSVAEARAYPYTPFEREFMQANRERLFVGSPGSVRRQIMDLAEQAGTREVMVTTIIHDHQARRHSYELLDEAFSVAHRH